MAIGRTRPSTPSSAGRVAPTIILGAGTGGVAAIVAARGTNPSGRIMLVSSRRSLPEVEGRDRPLAWLREARVDLVLGAQLVRVDPQRRVVHLRGHGELAFDRLVVDLEALAPGERRVAPSPGGRVVVLPAAGGSVGWTEIQAGAAELARSVLTTYQSDW